MARGWHDLFRTGEPAPEAVEEPEEEQRGGFFRRLRDNMRKTREALSAEVQATLFQGDLDEETWERLEEVEAALDDLNIDRFLTLLRRYADRAQFVVVTHQKRTMEAADALYGVSMGDDGVSKVVSRKLPRDVQAA